MKSIKKYSTPILAVTGLGLILTFFLGRNKQKLEAKAEIGSTKTLIFPVTVTSPHYRALASSYTANGFFVPVNTMALTSDIPGRIIATRLKDGATIRKGQIIVSVYNESETIERKQNAINKQLAVETLQKAKADLTKMETMLTANAISGREVDEQRLAVKSAESKLHSLNALKKSDAILAPISATVYKAHVQPGSYVSPGTLLADLVDISSLKLQVQLNDKEVINLSVGKKIAITPDLYPDYTITGTVVYIASQADVNRNFLVEIQLPNTGRHPLKAGMSGAARIQNDHTQNALMIPLKTIVGSLQQPQVYLLRGDVAVLKKITTGSVQGDQVVVLAGISTADTLVETGQLTISNGSKVQVINQ